MEMEHREAIQRNFSALIEQTDLDLMVTTLFEKGVFSEQMIEPYKDTSKDVRNRKRQLYGDITRRGPHAFAHLLDTLSEVGHWDLVRELDPNSSLHIRRQRSPMRPNTNANSYISISEEKKKSKSGAESKPDPTTKAPPAPAPAVQNIVLSDPPVIPQFNVIKSTKFFEEDKDFKLYRTRGKDRGIVFVFNYVEFKDNCESFRSGAYVDFEKLKYLFNEMGLRVIPYTNLTKNETLETLDSIKKVVQNEECVFVIVSSHGYQRSGSSDTDFRCSNGELLRVHDVIEHFSNKRLPALRGVPKVFIFQLCRGNNSDFVQLAQSLSTDGTPVVDARPPAPAPAPPERAAPGDELRARLYSDILIAHSTIPGFVSHRDEREGSWYIWALCRVFASRAHDCDVERLLTLVDEELRRRFRVQTSSVEKRGFNCLLYLHPGLHEAPAPAPAR